MGTATAARREHGCHCGDCNSGSHPAEQHAFDGNTRPAVDPDASGPKAMVRDGHRRRSGIYDGL
ncbi:hypothetical protein B8W66_17900 [Mycobacterium decipiens]|uniref:Uncharacterized protein n=1 Tax=Mycobacterium decipiens TaxID=1430326 RepID=A0A1X2LSZ8_9MYCO|nr:hypothetical protein B8W66_17900 [Mycobacterium decipiens]